MASAVEQTLRALTKARSFGGREHLNCIAELDETALAQAEALDAGPDGKCSPLAGMPVLVKDNIDVAGLHTTAGSLALTDNLASTDAPVIRNLRKRGAVILGKTNMTEFANFTTEGMPGGYSSRGGYVMHAANPSLSPSGSSSGSAVAVAAGIVPAAVGTDTSFSVVACAQENGICGLKPPVGSLSAEGIIPIARTLDSAGAMARNLTDALLLYSAMRDESLPPLTAMPISRMHIAVNTANRQRVSPEQLAYLQKTLETLRALGAVIHEVEQPPIPQLVTIMQWEFRAHLENYLRTSAAKRKTLAEIVACYETNPDSMMKYGITLLRRALYETEGGLDGETYLEAMRFRSETIRTVQKQLSAYDAVIITGPTSISHFCGLPSLSIPGKETTQYGVPRGIMMYGLNEARLYQAALAIEQILP